MFGVIKAFVGVGYAVTKWQSSEGVLDYTKNVAHDLGSLLKIPYTLGVKALEANARYDQCQAEAQVSGSFTTFLTGVLPEGFSEKILWLDQTSKSLGCQEHRYASIFLGVTAAFVAYQIYAHAKPVFSFLCGGIPKFSPKVVEKQDLNQVIGFLHNLIQNHELEAKGVDFGDKGLIMKMTTSKSLKECQVDLGEYDAQLVEDGDRVFIEIERTGYVIEITSSVN